MILKFNMDVFEKKINKIEKTKANILNVSPSSKQESLEIVDSYSEDEDEDDSDYVDE